MFDDLFFKTYNEKTYNCAHFCVDVWLHLTGVDISKKMEGFLMPAKEATIQLSDRNNFVVIDEPVSPCLVLMRGGNNESHIGVYFNNRIIHIKKKCVENLLPEIIFLGYKKIGYYNVR